MHTVIVGAGITGLALARKLLQAGEKVVVLERNPQPGGLCRSFRYGRFTFDIGPHRLFSAEPEIFEFFASTLGDEAIALPRRSAVFMNRKFLDWPLGPGSILRLPPSCLAHCALDLARPRKSAGADISSLRDYVETHYGPTIYNVFWKEYTRKFLGLACEEIAPDWAGISVARSLVDRKNAPPGLAALLRNTLFSRSKQLSFAYPKNGMGVFPDMLAQQIETAGGQIKTGVEINGIKINNNKVSSLSAGGVEYPAERLVWTGSLADLCRLAGAQIPNAAYLSTILFNVTVDARCSDRRQWVYFPDKDIVFSRVSFPCAFSPANAPDGKTGICVEVTCSRNDDTWNNPEAIRDRVLDDLVKVGLADSRSRILHAHIEKIPDTYPLYRLGYKSEIREVHAALGRIENLSLVGRQAMFIHDNIDEAIKEAWLLAARLTGAAHSGQPGPLPGEQARKSIAS